MSAKLIYSLTDNENPDLHKQIGCMNGFFQLFDRHRRIAGHGRISNAQPQNRTLQPGQNGNQAAEATVRLEKAKEKDSTKALKEKDAKKVVKEKRRSSTESSRHSFSSSSCSSSFSSLDYNKKTTNTEPSHSSQNSFSGTVSRELSVEQPNSLSQLSRKSVDLRDVVKDSMRREARGLSVKTATKESAVHTLKYFDSPRPMEAMKSSKPRNSGTNDALSGVSKDLRRLSYDGRESRDSLKSSARVRELPRLSLDSRQGAARPYLINDLRIEKRNHDEVANLLQEPGSSKRASSVVAKLMGLVDPVPIPDEPKRLDNALETEKTDPLSRSSRTSKAYKDFNSNSPRLRSADLAPKMNANQKFPIETAPWKQAPGKASATPLTVFGEIEKRLADLEFKKSGKDLRALKQILEAMQKSKVILDEKKDSKLASQASNDNGLDRNLQSNGLNSRAAKVSTSIKSPIVIMKPAKLMSRHFDSTLAIGSIDNLIGSADHRKSPVEKRATTKHPTPRNIQATNSNARTAKSAQASKAANGEENVRSSGRVSGGSSPRLQQKRLGVEKQPYSASPPDPISRRKPNGKQSPEHSSLGRRFKPRSSIAPQTSEGRDFCRHGNASPIQSESNVSLCSEDIDSDVSSNVQPDQNPNAGLGVNRKMVDPGRATPEQPSPISVLDSTFYRDESPSPVKKTSNAFKDYEVSYPDELEWAIMDLDQQCNGRKSCLISSDLKPHDNIKHWVKNPQEISYADKFFCDSTNPDHIYISDILSASDLPRYLKSGQTHIPFHYTGHLINPKLFFALEHHRRLLYGGEQVLHPKPDERLHRKLLFDVVNEILVKKLAASESLGIVRGKPLLGELCSEIDRLQGNNTGEEDGEDSLRSIICDDMTQWPMNHKVYGKEVPAVVLDIERLIFKDLVTELLVNGDAARPRNRVGVHCKQLSFN